MGLNSAIMSLTAPKPQTAVPSDIDAADASRWEAYREIWTATKRLKCSCCREAMQGRCKRGDERKARKTDGRPCFYPHDALLTETRKIVDIVLTTLFNNTKN